MDYREYFGEDPPSRHKYTWLIALIVWCVVLWLAPDPRPLGAPGWAVSSIRSATSLSEPESRAVATIVLRSSGLALIGLLLTLTMRQFSSKAAILAIALAPVLGFLCQYLNYGHFPRSLQLQMGLVSTLLGACFGLSLYRSRIAITMIVVLCAGLYVLGTNTGASDDLAENARITGEYLLDQSTSIPEGEQGFAELLRLAFLFAQDNSHGAGEEVDANKAAILALGVLLGHERVAAVAKNPVEFARPEAVNALRDRISLHGRHDLPRHFWVSAALTILSDEHRALAVGIGKEMMDATAGGSGFSFVDLVADKAGIQFAKAATKNDEAARRMQDRLDEEFVVSDFFPSIEGLPEGMTGEAFQSDYGGLGGKETQRLVAEIERRIATCTGLHPSE